MSGRYASPDKDDAAHHEYCRVVSTKNGTKKVVYPSSSKKSPNLPSGAKSGKKGLVSKLRAALVRPSALPPVRVERKSPKSGLPGAPASGRVSASKVGRAPSAASLSPRALVDKTVRELNFAGLSVYPRPIGKGSYGSVFECDVSNLAEFSAFARNGGLVHRTGSPDSINENDDLAVKIQVVRNATELSNLERESRVHQHVSRFAKSVAPTFYFAGFSSSNWTYVTITSLVKGGSLCPIAERRLTAAGFRKIERAVMNLWGVGVLHGDLHCNNIMVDSKGEVKIIDFGRAVVIPKDMRPKKISEALNRGFQARLQAHGNAEIRNRVQRGNANYFVMDKSAPGGWAVLNDKFQYSDDVQALRVLWKKLPDSEKRKFEVKVSEATSKKR